MSSAELMAVLKFDENDLRINRQGYMSEKQNAKLRRDQLVFVLFIGILIAASLGGLLSIGLGIVRGQQSSVAVVGILILLPVTLILVAYAVAKWKQFSEDLTNNRVVSVSGRALLSLIPQGRNLTYRLKINDVKFDTSWKIYRRIERGKLYRVYYAPRTKRILTMEQFH